MARRFRFFFAIFALAHLNTTHLHAGDLGYGDVSPQDIRMPTLFGNPEESVRRAEAAIAGLRPADDTNVMRRLGEVLTWLCEARVALGQHAEAEAACLEAVATLERASEIDGVPDSYSYELREFALPQLAATYAEMGNHKAALVVRERQMTLLNEKSGRESERIGVLTEIGGLQTVLGRFSAAEASYLEAIAADTGKGEIDQQSLPRSYFELAELYHLREQFGEAEATLQNGIARVRVTGDPSASDLDSRLHTFILQRFSHLLGWTYYRQNRFDEARQLGTALLDEYKSEGEGRSWFASDVLVLLGRIEDGTKPGSPEAKRHLTEAVNASGGVGGLANTYRALAQSALAHHHLLVGNLVAAEPYARSAVRTLDLWLGYDHYQTARARVILARVCQLQAKYDEALSNAQTAYAAQHVYLPSYHSELGETLALLAELYEATGDRENFAAIETLRSEHRAARAKFESEN